VKASAEKLRVMAGAKTVLKAISQGCYDSGKCCSKCNCVARCYWCKRLLKLKVVRSQLRGVGWRAQTKQKKKKKRKVNAELGISAELKPWW
jgi:hypothetical protein